MKQAFDATRLEWPMDWPAEFGREAPIFIEIGFGNAQFLIDLAIQNPEANVIGVEISLPSIKKAEKKATTHGLNNIRLIHGDAKLALWGGMQLGAIERAYINFPDPWHKAAHHHRKLINGRFLQLLATRMRPDGLLEIATDDPGYQDHITETLENTAYFASQTVSTYESEDLERIRTKYELKALEEGRICHYYHWARNNTAAENVFPHPKELDMPHVIIETPLNLDQISEHYKSHLNHAGETPVRHLQMFKTTVMGELREQREALLVETHVAEDPMPQRIALTIQPREDNKMIIGLHELGFPRPTEGIHLAAAHLARWLLSIDDRNQLKRHNLAVEL
ncbi:MAG: tRNA (guanosine(46)-N7)-methyltransferase TrmB [Chloroflexota bacterium]